MSFKAWFKQWRRSLYRLFMLGAKPHRSEKERKKAHERYVKAKRSRKGRYRVIEKKKRRRHGSNYKTLSAVLRFAVSTLSVLLLPFGLLHWGCKSARTRRGARKTAHKAAPNTVSNQQQSRLAQNKAANSSNAQKASARSSYAEDNQKPSTAQVFTTHETVQSDITSGAAEQTNTEPDENTPKSIPKNQTDQYIRKRMIIACSSYCDKDVLSRLAVGSYLEVVAEPNNPYDKDAVMLSFEGEKVGYISKKDKMPFVTCLKLGRKVYGVITEIKDNDFPTKYEFETWFENP